MTTTLFIGIDPGVSTGFALSERGRLTRLATLSFWDTIRDLERQRPKHSREPSRVFLEKQRPRRLSRRDGRKHQGHCTKRL